MKKILLSMAVLVLFCGPVSAQKVTPNKVLDLSHWQLSLPIDVKGTGKAATIYEKEIADGFVDPENFYVNEAGDGVVFSSPIKGVLTSKNTTYTRSELREMGRAGDTSIDVKGVNKNNWVFSSAPEADQEKAGAVDGTLDAVLTVDEVTTSGAVWLLEQTCPTTTLKTEKSSSLKTGLSWERSGDTRSKLLAMN